ncbi:energy-coupling factor ABC transporter permease, partial [Methanobrevibacter smithii]|uniref:energy-coupling factor ABC transporter permease n=1 Tax=Methanobrevibacter smithii TaxID=2173 RepID=UPI0037DC17AE
MHIPDGIITIDQALIYWILTILIMAICFYKFQKDSQKDKKIVSMAIFSVFTIIITSLSIPSPLGVPIHFFLIPLIAIILGPHSSSIVAFISLIIQALALNMGGLTSLGANFIVIG